MRGRGGSSGDWSAGQSEGGGASGTVRRQAWSVAEEQQQVLFDHKLAVFVCFFVDRFLLACCLISE